GHPARYLAFVLPGGEPDNLRMIDLGEAEMLDRLIGEYRAGLIGMLENRDLSLSRAEPPAGVCRDGGVALAGALFGPLAPFLGNYDHLFLAPDGELNRLPFQVLPDEGGRPLLDGWRFSYLTTGRDLLSFHRPVQNAGPPLVFADPDFQLGAA